MTQADIIYIRTTKILRSKRGHYTRSRVLCHIVVQALHNIVCRVVRILQGQRKQEGKLRQGLVRQEGKSNPQHTTALSFQMGKLKPYYSNSLE